MREKGISAFNLDFYTEVQDLNHLLPLLNSTNSRTSKFSELNERIVEVIEEFGLVSFETLAVEDKESMLSLVSIIDQALGYRPPPPPRSPSHSNEGDGEGDEDDHDHDHDHEHSYSHVHTSLPTAPATFSQSVGLKTGTIQEKWLDYKQSYSEFEKKNWEREGDRVIEEANKRSKKEAGVEVEIDR